MNTLLIARARVLITLMLLAGLVAPLHARVALVIGNSQYPSAALTNPVNDATDIAARLRSLDFEVNVLLDASRRDMRRAIREHSENLRQSGEVGLFYYAGHGMQIKGVNYLIPTDAVMQSEFEIPDEAVSANSVLRALEEAGNDMNIVILDACRDNPFAKTYRSASTRGLARMDAPGGSIIAYATAPGNTALDGNGRNGVYTKHLLANLEQSGMPIEQMFKKVRIGVIDESDGHQTPWEESSLRDDFYFSPAAVSEVKLPQKQSVQVVRAESSEPARVVVAAAAPIIETPPARIQTDPTEALLVRATDAMRSNRLTTPANDNALYYYRRVLAINPVNFDAHEGIQQITRRFTARAERAIRDGEVDAAARLVSRGLDVQPDDYRLLALRREVEEMRVQQTMLAARQEAEKREAQQPVTPISVTPTDASNPEVNSNGPTSNDEQITPLEQVASAADVETATSASETTENDRTSHSTPGLERPGNRSPTSTSDESLDGLSHTSRVAKDIKRDVNKLKTSLSGFGVSIKRGFNEVMRPKKKQVNDR